MGAPLIVEQEVPASAVGLWPLLTSADGLAAWWWPHLPDTTYAVDARPGGAYRIESLAAGIGVQGEFVELDAPRRLLLTWQWLAGGVPGVIDLVRAKLEERGGTTLVRVVHDMAGEQEHDAYQQGWTDVLGRLARVGSGDAR